jgi:hypothetical protein
MKIPVGRDRFAIVDDDRSDLKEIRWYPLVVGRSPGNRKVYAQGCVQSFDGPSKRNILMHRHILNVQRGVKVDHINGDTLDNRQANLRKATTSQNGQNRKGAASHSKTGVRGVFLLKEGGYRAEVIVNGERAYSTRFKSLAEAEAAVVAARQRFMTHSSECTSETPDRA